MVLAEMELGDVAEGQPGGQFMPEKTGGMLQGGHGLLLFPLISAYRDFYRSVLAVGADVDLQHFDREEARVGGLKSNQLRQFLTNCLGNA